LISEKIHNRRSGKGDQDTRHIGQGNGQKCCNEDSQLDCQSQRSFDGEEQIGEGGLFERLKTSPFAHEVAKLVLDKLKAETEQNFGPKAANIVSAVKETVLPYDNIIINTDENDSFDEEKLLKLLPFESRKHATQLLSEFDDRGNEITWNPNGIIFIDQVAIPQSNIYQLLPLLFQRKKPAKHVPGFVEIMDKIYSMGLGYLITQAPFKHQSKFLERKAQDSIKPKIPDNWWYIGP
jgi:hypothetical protein